MYFQTYVRRKVHVTKVFTMESICCETYVTGKVYAPIFMKCSSFFDTDIFLEA